MAQIPDVTKEVDAIYNGCSICTVTYRVRHNATCYDEYSRDTVAQRVRDAGATPTVHSVGAVWVVSW